MDYVQRIRDHKEACQREQDLKREAEERRRIAREVTMGDIANCIHDIIEPEFSAFVAACRSENIGAQYTVIRKPLKSRQEIATGISVDVRQRTHILSFEGDVESKQFEITSTKKADAERAVLCAVDKAFVRARLECFAEAIFPV